MEISGVRVKLIHDSGDRLKAVCTVTFDECFVVRDVKVVDGTNGLFVAMPSRKMSAHCPACRQKNHLKASYCNNCGKSVPPPRAQSDTDGRSRLHKDLAHPITPEFREIVQSGVLEAFQTELEQTGGENTEQETPREAAAPRESKPPREKREPRREKRSKPEREMDDIQPLELSEYDAIIADLKGGSSPAPRRERSEKPERREEPEKAEPARSETPAHRPEPKPEPAPKAAPKPEPKPACKPEPKPEPEPVADAGDSGSWPVFDDEPAETEKVEVVKPTPVAEPEPTPALAEVDDDDDGGFGAGIL